MRIIRLTELSKMLSVSKTTIWRWRQSGVLPEPFELGPKVVGWDIRTIEEWIESAKSGTAGSF